MDQTLHNRSRAPELMESPTLPVCSKWCEACVANCSLTDPAVGLFNFLRFMIGGRAESSTLIRRLFSTLVALRIPHTAGLRKPRLLVRGFQFDPFGEIA